MKFHFDEEDPAFNVFHLLNEIADGNSGFKSKYLDECCNFYQKNRYLTLDKIIVLNDIYKQKITKKNQTKTNTNNKLLKNLLEDFLAKLVLKENA